MLHFLVEDGEAVPRALEQAGLGTATIRPVLIRRLKQDVPGRTRRDRPRAWHDAGVNIETQYSDHANRLILVVEQTSENGASECTSDWAA